MTPQRYWLAVVLFHAAVLLAAWRSAARWADPARCRVPVSSWLSALALDLVPLAIFAYVASLMATLGANLGNLGHLRLGAISGRLMGQALFGEAILFGGGLAFWHQRSGRPWRAWTLGALSFGLLAAYVDAYHVEPRMLYVRRHFVDRAPGKTDAQVIRILHVTDIQTPVIGPHEEEALRAGMEYRPDLIVLTGDYVQNALGRPTEYQAAKDLRALMARIGFGAPLGVFATDGDAGPSCGAVFSGTPVRCLVDESALVTLPGGDSLTLIGLSRNRGRERDPLWLGRMIEAAPHGNHRIVISHAPDFVDSMPEKLDLALAGHTHGGQVVLPFFGPPRTAIRLPRRYAADLHDYRGTPLHVSRGVGMERDFTPPVRFLCPPEVCVLDVRLPVRH